MCVGFMYFHLIVLANVDRKNVFKYLKDQNAKYVRVYKKKISRTG